MKIIFLIVVLLSNVYLYAQIVSDFNFKNDTQVVVMNFRIKECPTKKYYDVKLSVSNHLGVYSPKFLIGDFQQVDCFGLKTIKWNKNSDSISFSDKDKIKIELTEVEKSPIVFNQNLSYSNLVDFDKNNYKTISIGKQTWMAENLRVKHFKNGDKLEEFSEEKIWSELKNPAWTNYNFDATYDRSYGKIYNWLAVHDKRGICPSGWRLPKIGDWQVLSAYIGKHYSGALLKEVGYSKWKTPNSEASNSYGFTGVPGGLIDEESKFKKIGELGSWWSSSVYSNDYITTANLFFSDSKLEIGATSNSHGLSVRCIKE